MGRGVAAVLVGMVAVSLLCPPRAANADIDSHAVSGVLDYGIVFPPGRWVPVRMEFRNRSGETVDGSAQLPVKNHDGGVEFRLPLLVPPWSRVSTIVYAYFPEEPVGLGDGPIDRVPPIAIIEWHSAAGARLAREEILARRVDQPTGGGGAAAVADDNAGAAAATAGEDAGATTNESDAEEAPPPPPAAGTQTGMPQTLLVPVSDREENTDLDSYDTIGFADLISARWGSWIASASGAAKLPREFFGYDSCHAVQIDAYDLDQLDQAQREKLLDYIRAGGIVITTVPLDAADLAGSWLAEYSPVHVIGQRQMNQIQVSGQDKPLKLREWVEVAEAISAGDVNDGIEVVVRDGDYVHMAIRHVGRGRIIFTSFPINALDPNDDRTTDLWMDVLQLDEPQSSWHYSELASNRDEVLQSMMGLPAPPWALAASIAGGYVAVVFLLQLFVGGARRPAAFMSIIGGAVLLSCGLVVANQWLRRDQQLAGARMAMIEFGGGNAEAAGGVQHEVFAYAGADNDQFKLEATSADTAMRPTRAAAPPIVHERPFKTTMTVHQGKIASTWQASAPLRHGFFIAATGVFGPNGLDVTVNNQTETELDSPLLLWGTHRFSLPSLPAGDGGKATASGGNRNLKNDYKNAAVFTSDVASLRGDILKASLTNPQVIFTQRTDPKPTLVGWLSNTGTPKLISTGGAKGVEPPMQAQTLVKVPVRIQPSPVGTTVVLDGAFNRLEAASRAGLPYQANDDTWIEATQYGQWLIGFAAPAEIGQLKTRKATVRLDVHAPQQKVTLRKGQCAGADAAVLQNLSGEVVAEWTNDTSEKTVTIECAPGDTDANGWIWLLVSVEDNPMAGGIGGTGALPRWQFRDFAVSYEAEVIGPPRPPILPTAPMNTQTAEESEPQGTE